MITVNNVTAGYSLKAPVLQNLTFAMRQGAIHGLIGANGAGKTTLLRVLAGQIEGGGGVRIFGEDPFDNPRTLDRTVLMGIDVPLPESWTARSLLKMGKARYSTWDDTRARELVEKFSIPQTSAIGEMSRGQRSALGFIYAFAATCDLTLLDEPYLGLDISKRQVFYETLREEQHRAPRTIVLSTHQLRDAEHLLDTITLIDAGSTALVGAVDGLAEQVLALTGTVDAVGTVLAGIEAPLLTDDRIGGARRAVIDIRGHQHLEDVLWEAPTVSVSGISLDEAVRALMQEVRR